MLLLDVAVPVTLQISQSSSLTNNISNLLTLAANSQTSISRA